MNTIYLFIILLNIVKINCFKSFKINGIQSRACERLRLYNNKNFDIFSDKGQLIRYITSFRNYTIISEGDLGKELLAKMEKKKYNTYYMDLNNLLDKNDLIYYLVKKYNINNSGENVWVFKKEFLIGSGEDALNLINKGT